MFARNPLCADGIRFEIQHAYHVTVVVNVIKFKRPDIHVYINWIFYWMKLSLGMQKTSLSPISWVNTLNLWQNDNVMNARYDLQTHRSFAFDLMQTNLIADKRTQMEFRPSHTNETTKWLMNEMSTLQYEKQNPVTMQSLNEMQTDCIECDENRYDDMEKRLSFFCNHITTCWSVEVIFLRSLSMLTETGHAHFHNAASEPSD